MQRNSSRPRRATPVYPIGCRRGYANQAARGTDCAQEPANCRVDGRRVERESGRLVILRPGEKRDFAVEVSVLDGSLEVEEVVRSI